MASESTSSIIGPNSLVFPFSSEGTINPISAVNETLRDTGFLAVLQNIEAESTPVLPVPEPVPEVELPDAEMVEEPDIDGDDRSSEDASEGRLVAQPDMHTPRYMPIGANIALSGEQNSVPTSTVEEQPNPLAPMQTVSNDSDPVAQPNQPEETETNLIGRHSATDASGIVAQTSNPNEPVKFTTFERQDFPILKANHSEVIAIRGETKSQDVSFGNPGDQRGQTSELATRKLENSVQAVEIGKAIAAPVEDGNAVPVRINVAQQRFHALLGTQMPGEIASQTSMNEPRLSSAKGEEQIAQVAKSPSSPVQLMTDVLGKRSHQPSVQNATPIAQEVKPISAEKPVEVGGLRHEKMDVVPQSGRAENAERQVAGSVRAETTNLISNTIPVRTQSKTIPAPLVQSAADTDLTYDRAPLNPPIDNKHQNSTPSATMPSAPLVTSKANPVPIVDAKQPERKEIKFGTLRDAVNERPVGKTPTALPERPDVAVATPIAMSQNVAFSPLAPVDVEASSDMLIAQATQVDTEIKTAEARLNSVNTSSHNPQLASNVARQIAANISVSQTGTTEISLNPEELGRVKLSLSATETSLVLTINTERPETTDLMRRHIDVLAEEFRALGYTSIDFAFGQQGSQNSDSESSEQSHTQSSVEPGDAPDEVPTERALLSDLDIRL
ncbi:flagellar hook-length control protein FliK [Aestuariibius sp. HNIBRBA575]|uniref:flagellar hook-length control protein FliK n=1 Tax=Aestuariibius sp. HNIBRBA575 TaxID=3233343 RepID=UPI0034A148F4